jgi:hypothetical protein
MGGKMSIKVTHKKYGLGAVLKERYGGHECYVSFHNGVIAWLPKSSLNFDNSTMQPLPYSNNKSTNDRAINIEDKNFKYRMVIEALRAGIAPCSNIEGFTFGRDLEINKFKAFLNDENTGTQFILGEYGTGKSHLLEMLSLKALEQNWVVAKLDIDPSEAPLYKPKRIYKEIIDSLKYIKYNKICNFKDLIIDICDSKNSLQKRELWTHQYFGNAMTRFVNVKSDSIINEYVWEWLRGDGIDLFNYPKMYDYQTAGNIYSYILSAIGWAAHDVLGLKGLLILLDEAESMNKDYYNSRQYSLSNNFFKGIMLMCRNDPRLNEECRKYSFYNGNNNCLTGSLTDLHYCGISKHQFPFLWKEKSNTKVIFSFIDFNDEDLKEISEGSTLIELQKLDEPALHDVLLGIVDVYKKCYGTNVDKDYIESIFKSVPRDTIRKFIKGSVEALDIIRYHPDSDIRSLISGNN